MGYRSNSIESLPSGSLLFKNLGTGTVDVIKADDMEDFAPFYANKQLVEKEISSKLAA
jgi:hypothetical protein